MNTTYDMKAVIKCNLSKVDILRRKSGFVVEEKGFDGPNNRDTVTLLNGKATLDDLIWFFNVIDAGIILSGYYIASFTIKSELFTYHVDYGVLGVKMENGIGLPIKKFEIKDLIAMLWFIDNGSYF